MKKLFLLAFLIFTGFSAIHAQSNQKDHGMAKQRVSPHDTVTGKNFTITYGRPYKKGRDIFGALEPYGKAWRLGADEATTFKVDKDCTFGDASVKAGTYTMFAIPQRGEWTIILNSQLGQWGAFKYDQYKDKDVAKTVVPVKRSTNTTEQLTIIPQPNGFTIMWDNVSVFVPVEFRN